MTAETASVQVRWLVGAGLRRWADGVAIDEAAVELRIGLGARFTHPRSRWIRPWRRGWYWLDPTSCLASPAG